MSDELDRKCVTELLTKVPERVYPIGRLDKNSEGLLLFTNDGNFANDIMHPSRHIAKTYRVTVRPDINDEQLIKLASGVEIDGKMTQECSVIVLDKQPGRVVLQMTIHEGRNRQIRKMCEAVGLEVARLKRTAIGPIKLGMLKPGEYRELKPDELRALRNAITKITLIEGLFLSGDPLLLCKMLNNMRVSILIMLLNVKYAEIGQFTLVNSAKNSIILSV